MSNAERASIHLATPGAPPVSAQSAEPEAQPPITTPPPQETQPDLGGPVLPNPSPEDRAAAVGGSVADRLRARYESMAATEEFGVPGWEMPDGRPGLVIVARAFGDRNAFNAGVSNEVFIAKSTHKLLFVNDDGSREEIEGGWGPGLAKMIGVNVTKAADLVALVISRPDPSNPGQRIPNVAAIGSLATDLINWSRKSYRDAEEDLGE